MSYALMSKITEKRKKKVKILQYKKYQISEQAIRISFIKRGLNAKEWKEQDIEMVDKYGQPQKKVVLLMHPK